VAQQSAEPDAIVGSLMAATRPFGATDLLLYLIDYEHTLLMPHPDIGHEGDPSEVDTVDGTMARRAFQTGTVLPAERAEGDGRPGCRCRMARQARRPGDGCSGVR
jgi:hypothetical protein